MPETEPQIPNKDADNDFAKSASELLKEFTYRLERLRDDAVRLLEADNRQDGPPHLTGEYLETRFLDHRENFAASIATYDKLTRQASQWMMHGETTPPSRLELEVRLSDFERLIQSMHRFFNRHNIVATKRIR